jgi:hypothetical protein
VMKFRHLALAVLWKIEFGHPAWAPPSTYESLHRALPHQVAEFGYLSCPE